jgi:acetate kinase
VRATSCENLAFLGIEIDEAKNLSKEREKNISRDGSRTAVLVVPTNEELVIALDTEGIVNGLKRS